MSITQQAIKEVEQFLQNGEKLNAVRHLKENYNFSLEESKILVDTLEGKMTSAPGKPYHYVRSAVLEGEPHARVEELLKSGKKFEAIRYVKETFGLRLKPAKVMVENLEKDLGLRVQGTPTFIKGPVGWIALIFGGLGMVFVIVAGAIFIHQWQSIGKSERITGKVTRLQSEAGRSGSSPVIAYEWNGQTWLHASNVYTSPPAYAVGEEVALFVNREDPTDVILDSFVDRWLLIMIFGILGGTFVVIPALGYFLATRQWNTGAPKQYIG